MSKNLFDSIHIPLVDNMILTSVTLPLEMITAANSYFSLKALKRLNGTISVNFYSKDTSEISTLGVLKLKPDSIFTDGKTANLVLIPALWRNPIVIIKKNPELVTWIKKQYQNGAIIVASGTGVVFLAEAGLLNCKPATTHWYYLNKLQCAYPNINFKPNHLITQADTLYCVGSVNSVADLIVHLIAKSYGRSIAVKIEQQFSHEIRRSFDDIYFSAEANSVHTDEAIVALQSWIHENYNNNITTDILCEKIKMGARTLNRRFNLATGCSPKRYLLNIRIDQARDLLKNTNLTIAEVSQAVGYLDSVYFSKLFKRECQLTPRKFRKSVREKLFKS